MTELQQAPFTTAYTDNHREVSEFTVSFLIILEFHFPPRLTVFMKADWTVARYCWILLGCDAVSLGEWFPTFRKIIVSPPPRPSSPMILRAKEHRLLDPEDGGTKILRNVGSNSPNDTASHPRRPECITFYLRQKGTRSFPSIVPTMKKHSATAMRPVQLTRGLMRQKERARAVKFPPRSGPLLSKHSSHKNENSLPYKGSRHQFLNISHRSGLSTMSHTEIASKSQYAHLSAFQSTMVTIYTTCFNIK
jgi:hypothetical protein